MKRISRFLLLGLAVLPTRPGVPATARRRSCEGGDGAGQTGNWLALRDVVADSGSPRRG